MEEKEYLKKSIEYEKLILLFNSLNISEIIFIMYILYEKTDKVYMLFGMSPVIFLAFISDIIYENLKEDKEKYSLILKEENCLWREEN